MSELAIVGAQVFDGESSLEGPHDVIVVDGVVRRVEPSGHPPVQHTDDVIDGRGATLLPGLIDAHVHADLAGLEQAARYGVTTVLDMGSSAADIDPLRAECVARADVADVRSALTGLTRPDGHPHQLVGDLGNPRTPTVSTVDEVPGFVADRVAEGADYLKTWLEDGAVLGTPVAPMDPALLDALVEAGHAQGLQVLVHALTRASAERAIASGADGLTHLFVDRPHTDELVARAAAARVHVVPTLVLLASLAGDPSAAALADEPHVKAVTPRPRQENLQRTWSTLTPDHFEAALAAVAALHEAGVPVLAGTDAAPHPMPGLAPGASLHGELRLLVRAGLSPIEALRSATSRPADRFGLTDRGRVEAGRRGDLLLVDGDPTHRIEDTLAVRTAWRGGTAVLAPRPR